MGEDCCRIATGEAPASIVTESPDAIAFMDINQATDGHVLIIPRRHIQDIYGMDPETTDSVFRLTVDIAKAVKSALRCDGLDLLQANERAGQQEVFHFHVHVIARYHGDRDRIRFGWQPIHPPRAELDRLAGAIRNEISSGDGATPSVER
jgi:histidine triad (HIT) family protein